MTAEQQSMGFEPDEVETEDLGITQITEPYDPDKIRIDHQTVNLGAVIEMLEYEEIDLMPDFQREGGLWDAGKKSRLIESILLGLPLPSFYFSIDEQTNKWSVVDGLQRLTSIKEFVLAKTLKLQELEFLTDYKDLTYDKLNRTDERKIKGFKVNLYIIEKDTPKDVKFIIFKRVNTEALVLTPQEIRHALNQGKPAQFIKKLASSSAFLKVTDGNVKTNRQEDRDFANRFVAFYLLGFGDKYLGDLETFMNSGMALLGEKSEEELLQIEQAFTQAMHLSFELFGAYAFRKQYSDGQRKSPISKSIFDTVSVNLAWLADSEQDIIKANKALVNQKLNALFDDKTGDFQKSLSSGTGQKKNVTIRFNAVAKLFKEVLHQNCDA